MFDFFKRLFGKFHRQKRFVFAHVDYMGEIRTFKVNVIKGCIGITYIYDPLILRLQPNGKCTIDETCFPGYGKETKIATWSETSIRPYELKIWKDPIEHRMKWLWRYL